MTPSPKKTMVYIDGFNLYYRLLKKKNTDCKWLNIKALAEAILGPRHVVTHVKYFTAMVSGRADPNAPGRQQVYIRALRTVPEISIHFGRFITKPKWSRLVNDGAEIPVWRPELPSTRKAGLSRYDPLTNPIPSVPLSTEVHFTEEKGSDVNLATHLLNDGWIGSYEAAAVLTNDTDLTEPIRIVARQLKKPVGLLCPTDGHPASDLKQAASFVRNIRRGHLRQSQLAPALADGKIVKPSGW
jgi:hypothetical protein